MYLIHNYNTIQQQFACKKVQSLAIINKVFFKNSSLYSNYLVFNFREFKCNIDSSIETIIPFRSYLCVFKYNINRKMNMTEKLSNPFLKPSPFRASSNTNSTAYYNYNNLNESKVAPFTPQYNMCQNITIKPTRDYDVSAIDHNRYAFKNSNRGQGNNMIDRIGYGNYDSYSHKKYQINRYKDYQRSQYDKPKINNNQNFGNSRINYNDNKSDAGSANTFINKIYQIDEKQLKYRSHENANKPLINPFQRKYLIRPDVGDIPIISNQFHDYYPKTNNYTQPNNQYSGGYQYLNHYQPKNNQHKQPCFQQYNVSDKLLGNQVEQYDSHQRTHTDYEKYEPKYENQLSLERKNTFDPNYNRQSSKNIEVSNQHSNKVKKSNPYISNRRYEDQEPQTYHEPVFGHNQDHQQSNPYQSKNKILSSNRVPFNQPSETYNSNKNLQQILDNVPRIIKFDEQSDQQRVKPQRIQNINIQKKSSRDKTVKDSTQYPMFIQLRGMTFHRIITF